MPVNGQARSMASKPTALQLHAMFFDQDGDGVVHVSETYKGFRDLKFNVVLSGILSFVIHLGFSYLTQPTILPDLLLRIYIKNIIKAKHGSDTDIYDHTGEFDEHRFEQMFTMFSAEPHTTMTFSDIWNMVKADRDPMDMFGQTGALGEWLITWLMLRSKDGTVKKEDIKGMYDGSTFYKVSGKPIPKKLT